MEPLIKRSPASSNHRRSTTTATGNILGTNQGGEDQNQGDEDRLLAAVLESTGNSKRAYREMEQLQLATNKVASIIMTPTKFGGHYPMGLPSSTCCRLKPKILESLEGQTGELEGRSRFGTTTGLYKGNSDNKSNIINNNNIDNNNDSSSGGRDPNETKKHTWGNSAPELDRPETMRSERLLGTTTAMTTKLHCWPATGNSLGAHCSIRQAATTKGNNRRGFSHSFWSLTILILIAYELYIQARNYSAAVTILTCQRCLPDVVFIRTCAAAELLLPGPKSKAPQLKTTELIQEVVVGAKLAEMTSNSFKTNSSTILRKKIDTNNNNYDNTINNETGNASGSTLRSAINSNAINKHHNNHQHNVLCNSRCNCVILEPFALVGGFSTRNNSGHPDKIPMTGSGADSAAAAAGRLEGWSSQRPPDGSTNPQTTTIPHEQQQTNSMQTNSLANADESNHHQRQPKQEQHQQLVEQALIAFSEDYSVDYEQQSVASGNGPDDVAGAADVADPTSAVLSVPGPTAASGNDRAPSRPADQSNAPASVWLGSSMRANATGGLSRPAHAAPSDTGSISNNNNGQTTVASPDGTPQVSSSSSLNGTLESEQIARSPLQVNQNDNGGGTSYTNEINGLNSKPPDAHVVVGSSSSRQRQLHASETQTLGQQLNATNSQARPLQTQKQQHLELGARQSTVGQLNLFPLPTHRHHHHHYQPLGPGSGGRESSGPQLYAQSLYSSQAPKLSYHAHTPYLKSAGSGQLQQPPQSQPATSHGDPLQPVGGSTMMAPPMGGHQHHHLRSSYLAHHQRQMAMGGGRLVAPSASSSILSSGSIQKLVPLNVLDASNRLNWNATTTNGDPMTRENSSSSTVRDWEESPQFADQVKSILTQIEDKDVQSLILRYNNIEFELWSELYALLAPSMRQHLFHLDMSHNSLAKLGITFTGYIEHHLAAHGSWPFNGPQSTAGGANQSGIITEIGAVGNQPQQQQQSKTLKNGAGGSRMKHTLLSGGKLYTLVKKLMVQTALNGTTTSSSQFGANGTLLLQQPMLLRALDLSHNKLKWLINDQFRALKHVQTIRLDFNRIRYINQHAFSGLESLRFLNLNFNRLQVIYIEQFQTNYNLLALMLRSNYLAYLRGGSFASLANLRRLDLSKNKLTIMSNNAFVGLESLETLNCSSNQFVHAPSASLHSLTSLRQLDLSDNLITQLAPGNFFHLPIEELWLNQNEQLVAIDRGAFWDLPYLRNLYLRNNPMLMSINPQAFVGTQSLQSIDVDGCQSLESGTRQMLDNITMAATSRLLRYEQSRLNRSTASEESTNQSATSASAAAATGPNLVDVSDSVDPTTILVSDGNKLAASFKHSSAIISSSSSSLSSHHIKRALGQPYADGPLKYLYGLVIVGLLVIALKLVFTFTSTSHYLDARRRRHRVYASKSVGALDGELDGQSMSSSSSSSSGQAGSGTSSEAYPMCVRPDNLVMGAAGSRLCATQESQPAVNHYQAAGEAATARPILDDDDDNEHDPDDDGNDNEKDNDEGTSGPENNDISVISDSAYCLGWPSQQQQHQALEEEEEAAEPGLFCESILPPISASSEESGLQTPAESIQQQQQVVVGDLQQQQQQSSSTIDLIHSQLIAAGFDYGHANCTHFYQSLGPALQLADMTANFVNSMDYY